MKLLSKIEFKDKLINKLHMTEETVSDLDELWDEVFEAAVVAGSQMPGIGFISSLKRYNAFKAVCAALDKHLSLEIGESTKDEHIISIISFTLFLLLFSDKPFHKAIDMFNGYAGRIGVAEQVEMPVAAFIWWSMYTENGRYC